MHVKLFWKNDRPNYKDGTIKQFSFTKQWKQWKDWMFDRDEWAKNLQADAAQADGGHQDLMSRRLLELENEIDAWLTQNPKLKIINIKQSAGGGSWSPSQWLISVWYEEAA